MKKKLNKLTLEKLASICKRWNGSEPDTKEKAINLIVGWCKDYNLNYADLKSCYDLP